MPCLLKERTAASPGIITFTHNEALRGVCASSQAVKNFLTANASEASWIFGVHVQGHLNFDAWPLEPWQSFILWPDVSARFLNNVASNKLFGVNCINFMPELPVPPPGFEKNVDILVISRAATIKRIHETLQILRGLMKSVPGFRAALVVPDMRQFDLGESCYDIQGIDRRFFDLPRKMFSSQEFKRLSFVVSSQQSFGWFPLANPQMLDLLHRSKFVLLTSHEEGTPRVIAEALLASVPCIVSRHLKSGISDLLTADNSVAIDDDVDTAVSQISDALASYDRFRIDRDGVREAVSAELHAPKLKRLLSVKIEALGKPVDGRWFFDDLHLRLAGHGQKYSFQFMNNERMFFDWMAKNSPDASCADAFDPYDEDQFFGGDGKDDGPLSVKREESGPMARLMQALFSGR